MTVLVYLPNGERNSYPNASGLQSKDGLITFYHQPDAGKRREAQNKKVTTTLPIFIEEEVGEPQVRTL